MKTIRCEVLGSGTSIGIPMPGCRCAACVSEDTRDKRLRSSLRLSFDGHEIIIDITPDFRAQALRSSLMRLDAVLLTHNHADHIAGLDDVRPYCFLHDMSIPVYGHPQHLNWVRKHFDYIWEATQIGGGLPRVELVEAVCPFELYGVEIIPVPVLHGEFEIYGYRIGEFAYISDVSCIPEDSFDLLRGVEFLVLDGLRFRPHTTHYNIEQAVAAAERIGARRVLLTHICHECMHIQLERVLPENIAAAFDGLTFEFRA